MTGRPAGRWGRALVLSRVSFGAVAAMLALAACIDLSATEATPTEQKPVTVVEPESAVTITYLANEGFLFEAGQRAVLIDALFGDGLKGYPTIPQPLRNEVENGRRRFADVDCVLATHFHGDHFSPWIVERFLYRVPAQFISTKDAVEDVLANLDARDGPTPFWARPARGEVEAVDCGGVPLSIMSFHHGRLMVKNLAFLVDFDGFTVLHVGDTEITADEIRAWPLRELEIDVALLPAWYFTEPSWTPVIDEIGARHLVAMHLAAADAPSSWFGSAGSLEKRIAEIRRRFPDVWIPTAALEERLFGPSVH